VTSTSAYDDDFHLRHLAGARRSAQQIVPHLCAIRPCTSVLDVGCGAATWLNEFHQAGANDAHGVDGFISETALQVPRNLIQQADLEAPLNLGRQYDWVLCLEVGEHLPPSAHETLVQSLCRHGQLIAFSAAVPHQGGTAHIAERWQSYWTALFQACGYQAHDVVRPYLWDNPEVELWYKQNLIVYAHPDAASSVRRFQIEHPPPAILDLMHPDMYHRWTYRQRHGIPET
jgi:SAM-dependent methyltransferase